MCSPHGPSDVSVVWTDDWNPFHRWLILNVSICIRNTAKLQLCRVMHMNCRSDLRISYITVVMKQVLLIVCFWNHRTDNAFYYIHCGHFNHKMDSEEQLVSSKISSCLMQISSCFSVLKGGSRSPSSGNRPAGQWDPGLTPFYSYVQDLWRDVLQNELLCRKSWSESWT